MKKLNLSILLTVLLSMLFTNVYAYDIAVANTDGVIIYYNWINDNTKLSVTCQSDSYNSYSGEVVIPESVTYEGNTYSVTSIGTYAFKNCSGLTSITIPNSVTSIGFYAFQSCSGLTSITIPNSVTSIGAWAFRNCSNLTTLSIGSGVTYITSNAFVACNNLTSLTLHCPTIGTWFSGKTSIEEIIIGNEVTSIVENAFSSCSGLTTLSIGNGVTSIGDNAFSGCSSLTTLSIGSGVTSIGDNAFSGCSSLTTLSIGSGVTSIGDNAFDECNNLASITFHCSEIGDWFKGDWSNPRSSLKEIIIGDEVKSIAAHAFYYCEGLTTVTIGSGVTHIGESAFSVCSSLNKVIVNDIAAWCNISFGNDSANPLGYAHHLYSDENTEIINLVIPNSVTSIGNYAFYYCSNLTTITIPNSVTSIGKGAFWGCNSASVTIPNSVTNIVSGAFASGSITSIVVEDGNQFYDSRNNCNAIIETSSNTLIQGCRNTIIPNGVTSIGDGAFSNTSLRYITIPNSVTSIGNSAFSFCNFLTSVTIPNSVTAIGPGAFYACDLTSVTIGSGVTVIGDEAFNYTSFWHDGNVYCLATDVPVTGDAIFPYNLNNAKINAKLHVPVASVESYSSQTPWSDFGSIVAISSEEITIGDLGIGTFCGTNPIDFSDNDDIKAYVVSSFEAATGEVTLTRILYAPAGTGIVVKGNPGIYTIAAGVGVPVYPNMLKGVTENTVLNKEDGDYTNYILANKNGNLGFYAVSDGSTLSAGKAYLPLPTADLPTAGSARGLVLNFKDGETTNIKEVATQENATKSYYDLQGRRVVTPKSGMYIVNGKKAIIK